MAKDYTQVNFRIPTKLKEEIEKAAKDSERSITSEIVHRLEQSFESRENGDIAQLKEQIARMDQTIKTLATTLHSFTNKGG